jgi:hypothetical protein
MLTDGEIKPLEVRHSHAQQILAIKSGAYWRLIRSGIIKKVGWGRNSRADYESLERYHRERVAATEAGQGKDQTGAARAAASARRAATKANEELVSE